MTNSHRPRRFFCPSCSRMTKFQRIAEGKHRCKQCGYVISLPDHRKRRY